MPRTRLKGFRLHPDDTELLAQMRKEFVAILQQAQAITPGGKVLTMKEIGASLGIPTGTAKSRLCRARACLRHLREEQLLRIRGDF